MTVAILIVNYNGGGLLRECLESIRHQQRPPDHVIVVDNGSDDDSLRQAESLLNDVEVIRLAENVGFAGGNNIAAAAAKRFDAIALLNPDAFPEPGWLQALVEAAERAPEFSSFASRMLFAARPDRLDGAGDTYHAAGRAWRNGHGSDQASWPARDVEVFAPCAAAALYRREAFEAIGGFDERYFCYFEDVDLGFRLRLRGGRALYVHGAVVRHVSSAVAGYRSDFAVYHGERNAVWTFVKDMPGVLFFLYLPQHLALNLASLCYYPLRGQGRVVFKAKLDALRGLPAVLRQRKSVQSARTIEPWALRKSLKRGVLAAYRRYTTGTAESRAAGGSEAGGVDGARGRK
jgi:GT2 family glycosyltransferase